MRKHSSRLPVTGLSGRESLLLHAAQLIGRRAGSTSLLVPRLPARARRGGLTKILSSSCAMAAVLMFLFSTASAQSAEFTQNTGGSNSMTIQVPLASYPGRGISLPVNLSYSSRGLWRVGFMNSRMVPVEINPQFSVRRAISEAIYAEFSTAGWTTSLDVPQIEWPKQNDVYWYTGRPYEQGNQWPYTFRIGRVFIHMPDGSTHELRQNDALYQDDFVRTTGTFYAVDGSRLRYDSTSETTGTLFLPDGSQYRLQGQTVQFVDRNGNTVNYDGSDPQNRHWSDTMGRTIGAPWPVNPSATAYPYFVPGMNAPFWLKFQNLSSTLSPGSPDRKPISDYYLPGPGSVPAPSGAAGLFASTPPENPDLGNVETYVVGRGQTGGEQFDPVVLAEIDLPNGQSYKFTYNIYGEIDKVVYPTGGYHRYEYATVATIGGAAAPYDQGTRGIVSSWLSANGNGSDEAQWTYSTTTSPLIVTAPDNTGAPHGTRSETYIYNAPVLQSNNFGFADARNGMVVDERVYAPAAEGGAMLRRTLTENTQTIATFAKPVPPGTINPGNYTAYRNPRPIKTVSLILDTGGDALAKTLMYEYASNGRESTTGLDRTASTESYFASLDQGTAQTGPIDSIPPGTIVSRNETVYLNDQAYLNRNILGLSTSAVLKDGFGTVVMRSETVFDEPAYPVLTYGDLDPGHYQDPGTTARGNVTTGRRYIDVSAGTYLETHTQYDQCGNPRVSTNERGLQSSVEYSAAYQHAFATQATSVVPDPSGTHGSTTAFNTNSTFDAVTGRLTQTVDTNGQVTTYSNQDDQGTNDPLNRLRKVTRPDGSWTKYSFGEALGDIYTMAETQQDENHSFKSYKYLDPMGRESRSFTSEGGDSYIATDTIYDSRGRVTMVSNPYRTAARNGVASTGHTSDWTASRYDALGRVDRVTFADSSTVSTQYQGIYTTVTDQSGRQRRQKTDTLGQVIRVDEPNTNGSLGTFDEPTQPSFYQYNTQGNLITVSQGLSSAGANPEDPASYVQHRYFKYDSVGRLTYEKQAEQSGTFSYADPLTGNNAWSRRLVYDETINNISYQGLLTTATDGRSISTHFQYDNLNRIYQVNYSDGTPTVNNYYDQPVDGCFNKGKLTRATTAAVGSIPATAQAYNYDLMGRIPNNQQTVGDQSYAMSYAYNLGSALTSQQYPSGRVVNYAFDDGARLSQVSSGSTVYASQFDYSTTQGLLKSVTLGNGAVESYSYNSRLQVSSLDLSRSGAQLQHYDYKYGVYDPSSNTLDETKNNGQIARIESSIGGAQQWQQNFAYDSLGRLSSAREFRGDNGQLSWLVNYDYDVFANRYQYQSQNGGNPFAPVWVEAGQISQITNRFNSGITYDDAGNILVDSKFRNLAFQYDANNRQKQSLNADGTGVPVVSVYDAGGQRVAIQIGGTLTNVLVYDASGKLVAEYGAAPGTGGPQYVFGDHQGSPRAITNSSGAIVSRHDYAPFGEEIGALGMRVGTNGYGAVNTARQKYAGMEGDDGTGMSHTLWRQYDSSSGRWTSPDPYGGSMSPAGPQSFNRYAYVNNDPVNKTDPAGLMLSDIGVYQTENAAAARYEEKNATWHTLRSATRLGFSRSISARFAASATRSTAARRTATVLGGMPWPAKTHDYIFATSFPALTGFALSAMQEGSRRVDWDVLPNTLDPRVAYQHGMIPGPWVEDFLAQGYSPSVAVEKAEQKARSYMIAWRDALLKLCKQEFAAGDIRTSMIHFGMAMHPMMDIQSPAHQWKVYSLHYLAGVDVVLNIKHMSDESGPPTDAQMAIMVRTLRYYLRENTSPEFHAEAMSPAMGPRR